MCGKNCSCGGHEAKDTTKQEDTKKTGCCGNCKCSVDKK